MISLKTSPYHENTVKEVSFYLIIMDVCALDMFLPFTTIIFVLT